jgi:hypothetical protein
LVGGGEAFEDSHCLFDGLDDDPAGGHAAEALVLVDGAVEADALVAVAQPHPLDAATADSGDLLEPHARQGYDDEAGSDEQVDGGADQATPDDLTERCLVVVRFAEAADQWGWRDSELPGSCDDLRPTMRGRQHLGGEARPQGDHPKIRVGRCRLPSHGGQRQGASLRCMPVDQPLQASVALVVLSGAASLQARRSPSGAEDVGVHVTCRDDRLRVFHEVKCCAHQGTKHVVGDRLRRVFAAPPDPCHAPGRPPPPRPGAIGGRGQDRCIVVEVSDAFGGDSDVLGRDAVLATAVEISLPMVCPDVGQVAGVVVIEPAEPAPPHHDVHGYAPDRKRPTPANKLGYPRMIRVKLPEEGLLGGESECRVREGLPLHDQGRSLQVRC